MTRLAWAAVLRGAVGHGLVALTSSWVTGSGPAGGWAGTGTRLGLCVSCFPPAVLPPWAALRSQPQRVPSEASSKIALDILLWIIPISYYCERKSQTQELVYVLVVITGKEQELVWAMCSGLPKPRLRHKGCTNMCFCSHPADPTWIISLCIFALSFMRINGVSFCLGKQFIHLRRKVSQLSIWFTYI